MTLDEKYMKAAMREAKKAYALDEVPIGCVIVQNDKINKMCQKRIHICGFTMVC